MSIANPKEMLKPFVARANGEEVEMNRRRMKTAHAARSRARTLRWRSIAGLKACPAAKRSA